MEQLYFYFFCTSLFFAFLLFKLNKSSARSEQNLPPGPWQLPIIGSIHHILMSVYQPTHQILSRLSKTYGQDLMHLKLGSVSHIVASSPRSAEEILKTHDVIFATRPLLTAAKILSYDGNSMSFAPYGDYWRQLRRICVLELLSPRRIRSFRSIREDEVQNLIHSISDTSSSSPPENAINISDKFRTLTTNVMTRSTVGNKCSRDDQRAFSDAVKEAFEITGGFDLSDLFPSWSWLISSLSGRKLRIGNCHQNLDQILDGIIQQRTAREETHDQHVRIDEDLLDVLLRLQKENRFEFDLTADRIKAVILVRNLIAHNLRSIVTTINIAGHMVNCSNCSFQSLTPEWANIIQDMLGAGLETSSTVLEWAMSELMRNPRVMSKAQSEVREIANRAKATKVIPEEDLAKSNYLHLLIKETLRLHPPGPLLLPRECQETCEILGYKIPKKARVLVNAWAIARDPLYWEEAESFKPERFEATNNGTTIDFKGANFEFLPFGSGRRMCPGLSFGLANVELVLAQILCNFDWELPRGIQPHDLDMREAFGLAASRKSDLWLRPVPQISCSADTL